MGSRKVNTEGIDEELLLASIGRRTQDGTLRPAQEVPAAAPTEEDTAAPEPSPVQPVTREKAQRESGRRKRQDEDYNELFLRRNEIKILKQQIGLILVKAEVAQFIQDQKIGSGQSTLNLAQLVAVPGFCQFKPFLN